MTLVNELDLYCLRGITNLLVIFCSFYFMYPNFYVSQLLATIGVLYFVNHFGTQLFKKIVVR